MTTPTISRDELVAELDTLTIVDALAGEYWATQHIPGAVAIAPTEVAQLAPALLPNKDAAIVTYCSNVACPNSGQVAEQLRALGYTNVRKYAEGIQDWTEAGLPVESAVRA